MKLICFDLDGTLINSIDGIYGSLEFACIKNKLTLVPIDNLRNQIGPPLQNYLKKIIYEEINDTQIEQIVKDFRLHHNQEGFKSYTLYPDTLALLNYIKEENNLNKIFIVTNKPFLLSKKSIFFLKINEFINDIFSIDGSSDNNFKWPDYIVRSKNNILKLLEEKTITADEKYYIGDTMGDFKATQDTKFRFIYASYGYGKVISKKIRLLKIQKILQLKELIFNV